MAMTEAYDTIANTAFVAALPAASATGLRTKPDGLTTFSPTIDAILPSVVTLLIRNHLRIFLHSRTCLRLASSLSPGLRRCGGTVLAAQEPMAAGGSYQMRLGAIF